MTTIITAIYGSYDHPKAFEPQSIPCRMLMISDQAQHPSCPWEVALGEHYGGTPRFLAKRPKLHPWQFSGDGPWIWIDGSMEIISPTFAEEALDVVETIGMWTHPARDCLYQEAAFSSTLPKYQDQPLAEQAEHYANVGFPRHHGLWAAGVIVYKKQTNDLSNCWMKEIRRWGIQDQVSLPVAEYFTDTTIEPLPYHLLDNPWVRLHFHHDGSS